MGCGVPSNSYAGAVSLTAVRKNDGPYTGSCVFDFGGLLFCGPFAGRRGFTGLAPRGLTTLDRLADFFRAAFIFAIPVSPMKCGCILTVAA